MESHQGGHVGHGGISARVRAATTDHAVLVLKVEPRADAYDRHRDDRPGRIRPSGQAEMDCAEIRDGADACLAFPTPVAFRRRKRGFSQVSLVAACGIGQALVARRERGQRTADAP